MRSQAIAFTLILFVSASSAQEDGDPNWDRVTRAVWGTFRSTPHMIDSCALKIAHEVVLDSRKDWPAYCNNFKDTASVKERVAEMRTQLDALKLSKLQREQLSKGQIAIGATAKMAELSWGRPESVNRTVTVNGASEQWVYPNRSYLYLTKGRVSGIQN